MLSFYFPPSGTELTFDAQCAYLIEMRMIDMGVHPEQPSQDRLCSVHKGGWEADTYNDISVV